MPFTVIPQFTPRGLTRYGCFACGIDHNRDRRNEHGQDRVVTTGIDIDFEGRLDLCESCVEEAASLIGMVKASEHERLTDLLSIEEGYRSDLTEQLNAALAQVEALKVAFAAPAPVPAAAAKK